MKKLRRFVNEWSESALKPVAATATTQEESSTPAVEEAPRPRNPCGPNCWLKLFLEYPRDGPSLPLFPATTSPAPDEQRRDIAQRLYSPIWSWQTRLIKIQPGIGQDEVRCELLVVDLIAMPGVGIAATGEIVQYEALSYSWGYPAFTHQVACNGLEVPIIQSLADALRHLRLSDRPRYLWIDAFCINQFDLEEKSRQVRNMLLIYQKCNEVIAWLGTPEGNDSAALHFLNKIATSDTPIRNDKDRYHDMECAQLYTGVCADLNHLLRKPWFERTWIRQEVFASKALTIHCGDDAYTANTIFRAIDVWQQSEPQAFPESPLKVQHLFNQDCVEVMRQSRIDLKRWLRGGTKLPAPIRRVVDTGAWIEGLLAGIRFGATDSRDKVYGIVGMLEERSKSLDRDAPHSEDLQRPTFSASIDYSKSQSVVYQDIVKFLINRDRNLLPLCVFQDRTIGRDGLPTWVMSFEANARSWYIASHITANNKPTLFLPEEFARAVYGEALAVSPEAEGTLKVVGHCVGTVRSEEHSSNQKYLRNVAMDQSIATSPPLPDRAGFHHFLKDHQELVQKCVYQEVDIDWHGVNTDVSALAVTKQTHLRPGDQTEPRGRQKPASALVSQAATSGDFLVVLYGSPLPFVLRPHGTKGSHFHFLGPACWSVAEREDYWSPGYGLTADVLALAQANSEKEEFWLI